MLYLIYIAIVAPLLSAIRATSQSQVAWNSLDSGMLAGSLDDVLLERRLLMFGNGSRHWITEGEKSSLFLLGENFIDITETFEMHTTDFRQQKNSIVNYGPLKYGDKVRNVISNLSTGAPEKNLWDFTTKFVTRHYRTQYGVESQKWLLSLIRQTVKEAANHDILEAITIQEFKHSWPQSSIILSINGSSQWDEFVIIAAHLDSASHLGPLMPAPGAEDDGSGTVTILEALRALLVSGFRPSRTVEFHWYAAEEGGLLGSQAIVKAYKKRKANVYAMTQIDMAAWVKAGTREEVGILTDLTDPATSQILRDLITAYLTIPHIDMTCGYGCSDHASWYLAGYPSSSPAVSQVRNISPFVHSKNDRIDISPEFSFTHMLEFSKIAVGFAIEMGEWTN